ncbi:MAG TPA: type II and III secretion system protein family protein [Vicinamibacterales bacterium]
MGRRLRAGVLQLLLAGLVGTALASSLDIVSAQEQSVIRISGANRTATVYVPAGKSQDLRTDDTFVDITVGDPTIADVNPLTDHTLSILGKKNGTTRVSVYGEGKKLVGIFDVEVGYETALIAAELKRRFPQASLKVRSINGRLLLSGDAPDATTVDQAMTTVKQFAPDVINSISVSSPQQVMLEVRFVEISRKAGRDLGVQWNVFSHSTIANIGSRQPAGNLPISAPTSTTNIPAGEVAAGVLSGTSPFGFLISRMVNGSSITDVMINALEERGVARSLAEPNLVALSGDTASFLAGGEFPVPVPGTLGQVSIEYKRYGVGLAFTPTVLSRGLINLRIDPEVSQLDSAHPVQVAGISVPPLIVRRASTTVELRDGQSFVIGGLLQNFNTTDQQQLPWIGDVPVLGALFRSASYQKNETDLVIIVTPRLVRPARPGDPVKAPFDNTVPPNDPEFFLLGKNEIKRRAARIAVGAELPETGHIIDLPKRVVHVETLPQ